MAKRSYIPYGQVVGKGVIAQIQMAVISCNSMNLQDGAENHQLNFHQVYCSAYAAGLPKDSDVYRSYCDVTTDASSTGGKDDQ